ncbi:MAG: HAF repeat-containing protein, partial [Armatimonadetes bacterium]
GMQDLGTLGGTESQANGVSGDGSVVVGWASDALGNLRAFRWTAATGMQYLGTLAAHSSAYDVSGNGAVIVGWSGDVSTARSLRRAERFRQAGKQRSFPLKGRDSSGRAFRWLPSTGMTDLNLVFSDLLSSGQSLTEAWATSSTGTFVGGVGLSGSRDEAFLLYTSNR